MISHDDGQLQSPRLVLTSMLVCEEHERDCKKRG